MSPMLQALVSGLALAGSAIAVPHNQDVDSLVASQILTDPYAYDFPRLGAPGASLFPMRLCHGFKLEEASVDDLQKRMSNGSLTSVQLLDCYLDRIYQTQPYLK
jgi:amidase